MKRIITLIVLCLLAIPVMAQEPAVSLTTGFMIQTNSKPVIAYAGGGNINVLKKVTDSTVTGQVFLRPAAIYADDYNFTSEQQAELQGAQVFLIAKVYRGPWSIGLGLGGQTAVQSGADQYAFVPLFEFGYKIIPELTMTIGGLSVPVNDRPDYYYPYISFGINVKDLL